jgi:hypothetical protein
MKKMLFVCAIFLLVSSSALMAQGEGAERPEPNLDAVVEHLGLTDVQLDCLDANRDDFHDAVEPSRQQLRDLKRQFRQTAQEGGDTTSIQSQIDAVKAVADGLRSDYVGSAQACIGGQTAALNELIAAETLMMEVRQAAGLLLIESTNAGPVGRGRKDGRRGPSGPGGQGGPGGPPQQPAQ